MRIADVTATWIRHPIPPERQHVSDFGRMETFDCTLVAVTTEDGLNGYGEAKAAVGSAGVNGAVVASVTQELRPLLLGEDSREIARLWERMYNGSRDHFALTRGRGFPILGRRGVTISAMSGVDMALWDLLGRRLGVPVYQLLGGRCREALPAYASGGWADAAGIGAQLRGYLERGGFRAVKMRVGSMDGTVEGSIERVHAARAGLGPEIDLMVDAHGTFNPREARRFAGGVAECRLAWFEEPVNSDDRAGMAEVRASTDIPIAAGESEFTRFDFRDLIEARAVDILQPDLAIAGGITEGVRIAGLAAAYQKAVAPHLWGSALGFAAGLHLAAATPACTILEYSLGFNPMLHELVEERFPVTGGMLAIPDRPGLGVTVRPEFVERCRVT
jgi:D-galactarolactone cycloisomerase